MKLDLNIPKSEVKLSMTSGQNIRQTATLVQMLYNRKSGHSDHSDQKSNKKINN